MAIQAMGSLGRQAEGYADSLCLALNRQGKVRVAAALALGQVTDNSRFADYLLKCLDDKDEEVKVAALTSLGRLRAQDLRPSVVAFLGDLSPAVSSAACRAMGHMGPAEQSQVTRVGLMMDSSMTRYAACCCLADLGGNTSGKFIDKLIDKCLVDEDSKTRVAAAAAVGTASEAFFASPTALTRLLELLGDAHPGIRCSAALALGHFGSKGLEYAGRVAALLTDSDEDTTENYLWIGGGNSRSPSYARRPKCAALKALTEMGARSFQKVIGHALMDDSSEVRLSALECIQEFGQEVAISQSAKLLSCLEDSVYFVKVKACEVIAVLRLEDAMGSVPFLLEDKSPAVRFAALKALAECPEVARVHSSEIYKSMDDEVPSLVAAAISLLGKLGKVGRSYASIIATHIHTDSPDIRVACCEALGNLGEYGAAFADEVRMRQQDPEARVREAAIDAMAKIGPMSASTSMPRITGQALPRQAIAY